MSFNTKDLLLRDNLESGNFSDDNDKSVLIWVKKICCSGESFYRWLMTKRIAKKKCRKGIVHTSNDFLIPLDNKMKFSEEKEHLIVGNLTLDSDDISRSLEEQSSILPRTHTLMSKPYGNFSINDKEQLVLFEYLSSFHESDNINSGLCMTEYQDTFTTLYFDFDVNTEVTPDINGDVDIYNEDDIPLIVDIINKILIKSFVDVSNTSDILKCYNIKKNTKAKAKTKTKKNKKKSYKKKKKKSYTKKKIYKKGFHLHYPEFRTDTKFFRDYIVPRVYDEIITKNTHIFHNLPNRSSILDSSASGNNWLLYGCSKNVEKESYRVKYVYIPVSGSDIPISTTLEEVFGTDGSSKLPSILSIRRKDIPIQTISPSIEKELREVKCDSRLQKDIASMRVMVAEKDNVYIDEEELVQTDSVVNEIDYEYMEKLVGLLSVDRSEDYKSWIRMGWTLFNISNGSQEGFNIWNSFSMNGSTYDYNTCVWNWNRIEPGTLGLGTLCMLAKKDNPDGYNELIKSRMMIKSGGVMDEMKISHRLLSQILYEMFKDEYMNDPDVSSWFYFNGVFWEKRDNIPELLSVINTEIYDMFHEKFTKMSETILGGNGGSYTKEKADQIKRLWSELKTLHNSSTKKAVETELLYNKGFMRRGVMETANKDPNIFPFSNGVYDIKTHTFSNTSPDQYITRVAGVPYPLDYKLNEEQLFATNDFLKKTFTDIGVRNFFIDIMSTIFEGTNFRKEMYFWTGQGNNGKSIMMKIFEKILGGLLVKLNTKVITGEKPSAGSPNPEISRCAPPVRVVVLEEPDNDEQINGGTMKHITGNDSLWARDLYQAGSQVKEFTPQFKVIFVCNSLPTFKNFDQAVANRVKVIPFDSTFIMPNSCTKRKVPKKSSEQFKAGLFHADLKFEEKLPGMIEPLVWILLNRHRIRGNRPIIEPPKVQEATQTYREHNSQVMKFLREYTVKSIGNKVTKDELYGDYKIWALANTQDLNQNEFGKSNMMTKEVFWSQISTFTGVSKKSRVLEDVRLRTHDEIKSIQNRRERLGSENDSDITEDDEEEEEDESCVDDDQGEDEECNELKPSTEFKTLMNGPY